MSLGRLLPTLQRVALALISALVAACASNPTPHPGTGSDYSDVSAQPPESFADSGADMTSGGTMGEVADGLAQADQGPDRADEADDGDGGDAEADAGDGTDTADSSLHETDEATDVGPTLDDGADAAEGLPGAEGAPASPENAARTGAPARNGARG